MNLRIYTLRYILNIALSITQLPYSRTQALEADFAKLTQTSYFIDKTLFIKHFIESFNCSGADRCEKNYFSYITTPRGFAKSLNLDMLRKFLELNADPITGTTQNVTATKNYALFANATLNLRIANERILIAWGKYEKYLDIYFGQYPVIFLSFKSVDGVSFYDMVHQMGQLLRQLYSKYEWLYELRKSNPPQLSLEFQLNFYETILHGNVLEPEIRLSLRFLYLFLSEHFDRHVILLIDDFDYPILNAITRGISTAQIYPLVHDMIEILQCDVGPPYKKIFAILTGTSQLFVNLNNTHRKPFLQHEHSEDFAINELDVKGLHQHEEYSIHHLKKVGEFANGYQTFDLPETKLYNPYDVAYYFEHENFPNCASSSYMTDLFHYFLKQPQVRQTIVQFFFHKKAIVQFASFYLSFNELQNFVNLSRSTHDDQSSDLFYFYLFENGFFTCNPNTSSPIRCHITNNKIVGYIKQHLINYYLTTHSINFTDNPTINKFHTLIRFKNSTSYMLNQFQHSLNRLFKPKNHPIVHIDQFEFLTIIRSIALCNFEHVYVDVEASSLNLTNKFVNTDYRFSLVTIHKHPGRQVIQLVQVTYRQNITETMQHLVQYIPIDGTPRYIIKYLVVNIDEYNIVEVRGAPNFYSEVIRNNFHPVDSKNVSAFPIYLFDITGNDSFTIAFQSQVTEMSTKYGENFNNDTNPVLSSFTATSLSTICPIKSNTSSSSSTRMLNTPTTSSLATKGPIKRSFSRSFTLRLNKPAIFVLFTTGSSISSTLPSSPSKVSKFFNIFRRMIRSVKDHVF